MLGYASTPRQVTLHPLHSARSTHVILVAVGAPSTDVSNQNSAAVDALGFLLHSVNVQVHCAAGHTNVFYVGDRVKRPGQLNGKSANLNHAILRNVFPSARTPQDIPLKDILLVMDVDHMVKPDIFNRMG